MMVEKSKWKQADDLREYLLSKKAGEFTVAELQVLMSNPLEWSDGDRYYYQMRKIKVRVDQDRE